MQTRSVEVVASSPVWNISKSTFSTFYVPEGDRLGPQLLSARQKLEICVSQGAFPTSNINRRPPLELHKKSKKTVHETCMSLLRIEPRTFWSPSGNPNRYPS